ncbi:MAG: hypothetical protein CTY27_00185 [Methylotenera sp.]|nr:MAG: hypothetical protein CTY27_00185 [Methylotenera sp.]
MTDRPTKYRVVDFISKLLPIYTFEHQNNITCARSLIDGTLIHPHVEGDNDPNLKDNIDFQYFSDEHVTVYWQGDPNRKTEVHCIYLASLAVVKYVEFYSFPHQKLTMAEYEHLFNHFKFKTGVSLMLQPGEPNVMRDIMAFFGKEASSEVIKKSIGI